VSSLTLDDVVGAQQRIAPHIVRTPLVASWALSARVGAPIWLKLETRQHTGSFKARGALNKILRLSQRDRDAGIVAASAGNHALGVAYACEIAGVSHVDLYVQSNASPAKLGKLRRYPVAVHLVGTTYEEAAQAAQAEVHRRGATFVSAYDDLDVAAGQGTIGLEILEELPEAALVVVPVRC
jgi:threonine dehydratase